MQINVMKEIQTMNMNKIRENFFDNCIRPEAIIHLGTQCLDNNSWPDVAKDAFQDDFENVWEAIGIDPPAEDVDDIEIIEEHLRHNKKYGFLVQFATPVPTDIKENCYSLSWGYYTTQWIYADTYESACEKAVQWQADYINGKRKKAAA
jgi:hypothetical protein